MVDSALVLEGGSLRCLFTAGVLDYLMEKEVEFAYVNGVSSGSLSGLNYVSKQKGRTAQVNLDYVGDRRYLGLNNLVHNGGIFNFDFLFQEIGDNLNPFDYKAFENSGQRFVAVATNCRTGKEEYFEKGSCEDMMMAARASCSMPLLSQMIPMNGELYLDGGVAMPIAYKEAMRQGYEKIVVILTREQGYRKKPNKKVLNRAFHKWYAEYPKLLEKLYVMPEHYNKMQEEMEELERQGKLFIIRPEGPVGISRVEKDTQKLRELYEEGRSVMEKKLDSLEEYLGIKVIQ